MYRGRPVRPEVPLLRNRLSLNVITLSSTVCTVRETCCVSHELKFLSEDQGCAQCTDAYANKCVTTRVRVPFPLYMAFRNLHTPILLSYLSFSVTASCSIASIQVGQWCIYAIITLALNVTNVPRINSAI